MQFDIRALSPEHQIILLRVEAFDEIDARKQVEKRGLYIASIVIVRSSILSFRPSNFRKKHLSLVLFSQELLALLNAGLSIVECLEALLEKETNLITQSIIERLLAALRDGKRFSSALAEQPDLFPPLYIGIVRAAEGTSDLPNSLSRFISYQTRVDAVRSKIISAAIYPLILLAVGGIVSCFLIGYVVPRFSEVYQGAGRDIPWLSQLLMGWGKIVASNPKTVLLIGVAILISLFVGLRYLILRGSIVRLLFRLPTIGEKAKIYELSRLYLTLGMLLEGGTPIVPAIETLKSMVSPNVLQGLNNAKDAIQSGAQFSSSFEANHLTTPISLRMLRVGERSGELGKMLTQSAAFYDGEITRWIDRFTRTFEPLLMVAIGLIVGLIVVLLYMPIFDLAGSLS
ncbi:putative type II secretion system protein F [compost metagenome]